MSWTEDPTKYVKKRGRTVRRPKFGIECRFGYRQKVQPKQRWVHWRWYETKRQRDKALEGLGRRCLGHILYMEFRAKER